MKDTIYTYQNRESSITIKHSVVDGFYTMCRYHFHTQIEIYFLVSGQRNYFIRDKIYNVCAGDLVFISPHEIHKTIDTEVSGHERILINMEPHFVETRNHSLQTLLGRLQTEGGFVLRPSREDRAFIHRLLNQMITESQGKEIDNEVFLQALVMQLLVYISRYHDRNGCNRAAISDSPTHLKISRVVEYINGNYREKLTVEDVAARFFFSPFYFCRIFKDATGFTFIEYLNTVRIREAQILLLEGKYNITGISEQVGFGSITHFNRIFKKVIGESPLQYRKKLTAVS